jgi:ABC-2 type transport system permease protein
MYSKAVLLFRIRIRSLIGAAASEWENNRLKLIAAGITMSILIPGIYLLFHFLFSYIYSLESTFPGFGIALARRLLGMTFMSIGVFIGISSFICGVSAMFRSKETTLLLSLPVQDRLVAFFRMIESWFNAGWATVLLGVPIIIAFNVSLEYNLFSSIIAIVLFPFLLAVWVSSGTVLLGTSIRMSQSSGKLWRAAVILGFVVTAGIYLVLKSSGPEGIVAEESAALEAVHKFVADLPVAGGRFWPHILFGNTVFSVNNGIWIEAFQNAGILILESAVAMLLAYIIICPGFRKRFSAVSTVSSRRRSSSLLLRSRGKFRTMLQKDILVFMRDPVQWSQLLLLTGLFLVYAFNINRFPMDTGNPLWRSIVVYLNFSFTCFVTATILVRFTFPAISLEGAGLSYILQLPAGRKMLLKSKLLESFLFITPFIIGIGIWSTISIGAGPVLVVSSAVALGLMCIALVSINTCLGAVFPRFDKGSAASIASGHGGIIAACASMGYVLVAVSVLGMTIRRALPAFGSEQALTGPMTVALIFLGIVTGAVTLISLKIGYRSLKKRDF